MAFIRKADIEKMLAGNPYHRVLPTYKPMTSSSLSLKKRQASSKPARKENSVQNIKPLEYISGEDVMRIYKVKKSWLYASAKNNQVPICKIRVDLDGNTNDVHDIHKRAMMAAEIINMRHGWKQPKEIREMRKEGIKDFCEYTLRNMQEFDIDYYFKLFRMKGYEVTPRFDKDKKLVGYTIGKNASVFKASEVGRRYMASQLEASWKKLHPAPTQVKVKPASPTVIPSTRPTRPVTPKPTFTQTKVQPSVQPKPTPAKTVFNIDTGSEVKKVWISDPVKDIFLNEAQVPEGNDTATVENIAHTAMLLFAGYIDAATSMSDSCGGGGDSSPKSGWCKKDDEDERAYARRCLQMAHSMCKPKSIKRGYHR